MAMGLVNPEWLKVDEHAASIVNRAAANLPNILAQVEEDIILTCSYKQVNLFDIPLKYNTGTGTISTVDTAVTGVGTAFTDDLGVGVILLVGEEKKVVESIESDTELTLASAFDEDLVSEDYEYSGYINSIPLKTYSVWLSLFHCCLSFWGSGRGADDIYKMKMPEYERLSDKVMARLTRNSILGIYDPETGVPDAPESFIQEVPGYL